MTIFRYSCLISLLLITVCCENQTIGYAYHHIGAEGWKKKDTLSLELPIADTLSRTLHLQVIVRNNSRFPYRELPLCVSYGPSGSEDRATVSLRFALAGENGKWEGAGWSGLYQSSLPLETIRTKGEGSYQFSINHLLADEVLAGITDVGVQLKR